MKNIDWGIVKDILLTFLICNIFYLMLPMHKELREHKFTCNSAAREITLVQYDDESNREFDNRVKFFCLDN